MPIEHNHTIHRGLDGARRVLAEWNDSWSSYGGQVERVIDAEELGVVVVFDINAVGAMSGVEVTLRQYAHFRTREGKVAYLYEYANLAEALSAVGLEE